MRRTDMRRTLVFLACLLIVAASSGGLFGQRNEPPPTSDHDRLVKLETQLEERLRGEAEARRIQTDELARRLTELNHAHEQSVKDKEEFVKKGEYETHEVDIRAWREQVSKQLSETQGRTGGTSSAQSLALSVLSLVIAIGAPIAIMWRKRERPNP